MSNLRDLADYLKNQIAEAGGDAAAYRRQAAQCALLRAGLQSSLDEVRRAGGDRELELFLLQRLHDAVKAELENTRAAAGYDDAAASGTAALERLGAMVS